MLLGARLDRRIERPPNAMPIRSEPLCISNFRKVPAWDKRQRQRVDFQSASKSCNKACGSMVHTNLFYRRAHCLSSHFVAADNLLIFIIPCPDAPPRRNIDRLSGPMLNRDRTVSAAEKDRPSPCTSSGCAVLRGTAHTHQRRQRVMSPPLN